MLIAHLNFSTHVSDQDMVTMTSAIAHQMRYHVAPAWDRHAPSVVFYKDQTLIPPGSYVIALFDNSDQAGDLGWHTESPDGKVYGRVFVNDSMKYGIPGGTVLQNVCQVLSHEVIEAWGDPFVNLWVDGGDGYDYALEFCDPVEAQTYTYYNCLVSNFILPAWTDPAATSKFDHLGQLTAPLSVGTNGYLVRKQGQTVSNVWGDQYPVEKQEMKAFPAARTARRQK